MIPKMKVGNTKDVWCDWSIVYTHLMLFVAQVHESKPHEVVEETQALHVRQMDFDIDSGN